MIVILRHLLRKLHLKEVSDDHINTISVSVEKQNIELKGVYI